MSQSHYSSGSRRRTSWITTWCWDGVGPANIVRVTLGKPALPLWKTGAIHRLAFGWPQQECRGEDSPGWMVKALNGRQNSSREPYCPGMGVEGLTAVKFRDFPARHVKPESHGHSREKIRPLFRILVSLLQLSFTAPLLRIPVIEPEARADQAPGRRLVAQPPSSVSRICRKSRHRKTVLPYAPQTCANWPSGKQLLDIYLIMIINKKKVSG